MAKRVWYVGHDTSKKLTNDHWKSRVGKDLPELNFNAANGFSADVDDLDPEQLKWFSSRADFYIVDVDTARTDDAVPPLVGTGGGDTGGGGGGGGVTEPVGDAGFAVDDNLTVSFPPNAFPVSFVEAVDHDLVIASDSVVVAGPS